MVHGIKISFDKCLQHHDAVLIADGIRPFDVFKVAIKPQQRRRPNVLQQQLVPSANGTVKV